MSTEFKKYYLSFTLNFNMDLIRISFVFIEFFLTDVGTGHSFRDVFNDQ